MELKRFVNILRFSQQIKLVEAFMLGFLLQFADLVLTVYLVHRFNPYLILGLLFLTAFFGFLFSKIAYSFVYKETRTAFRESGEIPYRQFDKTLGTCVCAFLMVMPGFITFAIGLLCLQENLRRCLQENLRRLLGTAVRRLLDFNLEELYNYMRLYEVEV